MNHTVLWRIPVRVRFLIAYVLGPLYFWSAKSIRTGLVERGFKYLPSLKSIREFCRKFRTTGNIADKPRSPKRRRMSAIHIEYVNWMVEIDREVTVVKLCKHLKELFHVNASRGTVRAELKRLGWTKKKTRYCQLIRHVNKPKRLLYAMLNIIRNEQFDDCIFTDESSIQLMANGYLRFRRQGESVVLACVGKPKHPFKVHVWAGISKRGPTKICIFTGMLNAIGLEKIFAETLLPFIGKKFPNGHRLIQDNDPKHTSKRIKVFMTENNINHWRTPPESPDLNPIEMIWADMKCFLSKVRPTTKDDLIQGIRSYWDTVTSVKCERFISHLKKVMPIVVLNKGGPSGH